MDEYSNLVFGNNATLLIMARLQKYLNCLVDAYLKFPKWDLSS